MQGVVNCVLFTIGCRNQDQNFGFVPPSQFICEHCNERSGDASAACVDCAVNCPMVWPKPDHFFEVVQCMGKPGAAPATKLESVSSADLITAILTIDKVAFREEFVGMYWSAVADLLHAVSWMKMLCQVRFR